MERHHVAGRRKTAYLFYVLVHHHCHHLVIHANGKWAEEHGLLWPGRNSKVFTHTDADALVKRWPFPQQYPLTILQSFSPTKT